MDELELMMAENRSVAYKMGIRLDADETYALTRALEHHKAKVYEEKFPQFKSAQFIPESNEAPAGAESILFQSEKMAGVAEVVANDANDIKVVDVTLDETATPVRTFATGYNHSFLDVERAAQSGRDLPTRKAMAARKALERKKDAMGAFGEPTKGVYGLLNHPDVTLVAPTTGTWGGAATNEQIKSDFHKLAHYIVDATNQEEEPDTVLMPLTTYNYISVEKINPNTDMTILQAILANSRYIRDIFPWHRLETAGAGGAKRMVAYKRDPEVLQHEVPMQFRQLPGQFRGLGMFTPIVARSAGVQIRYPKAVAFMDGI